MNNANITKSIQELNKILGTQVSLPDIAGSDKDEIAKNLADLISAYKEKNDVSSFLQSLILGKVLQDKVKDYAKKFHIAIDERRALLLLELKEADGYEVMPILKGMFPSRSKVNLVMMDARRIALLIPLNKRENIGSVKDYAKSIESTINAEAMIGIHIASGEIFDSLYVIDKAYDEALYAMRVGKMFQYGNYIFSFSNLGIGRLIAEAPYDSCLKFLGEVFGEEIPDSIDEDTFLVVNAFLKNNLNIAETSRALHMHRNTLIYRMEQIHKNMGLDIRNFEEAMTLKIAIMVLNYLNQMK